MSETTTESTKRSPWDGVKARAKAIAEKYGIDEAVVLAELFPTSPQVEQSARVKNLDALIAANSTALKALATEVVAAGEGDKRKLGIFIGHDGSGEPTVKAIYGREGHERNGASS